MSEYQEAADAVRKAAADSPRSLDELNRRLEKRFRELRAGRPNYPLYGLEHALEGAELGRLFELVGAEVRRFGISHSWCRRPYPLIVASSEIGYEYRGTGTDFWPRFEAAIGASLGSDDRQQHTNVFEIAHDAVGIRKPAASPWTRAFRHIAWPIANAVAPREIHRPLARALQEVFRASGSRKIDQELLAELRFAARHFHSTRFAEWLADEGPVVAVVSHLLELDDPENRLSADTADRILKDLESDPTAKRAVKAAVRLHRERPGTGKRPQTIAGNATFVLRQKQGDSSSLWLRLPPLPAGRRHQLKAAVSEQGLNLRLWGGGEELELDMLLSGLPLPLEGVDLAQAFLDQRPFLEVPGNSGDEAVDAILGELAPRQSDPIVLQSLRVAHEFQQVLGERVRGSDPVRVLTSRNAPQGAVLAELPRLAGFRCFEVDMSAAGGREWLRSLGVIVGGDREIQIFGGIRLSEGLKGPVFAEGLPLMLQLAPTLDEGEITCRADRGPTMRTNGPSPVVVVHPAPGDHIVELEGRGLQSDVHFAVVTIKSELDPLSLSVEPISPTIDDLLRQQVVFRVSAPVKGDMLHYRLSLAGAGGTIGTAAGRIETLPATISSSDPVLASLTEQLREAPPPRDARIEIRFELGPHWIQRWQLDWEPTVIVWEEADGTWRAFDDAGGLSFVVTGAGSPLASPQFAERYEETSQYSLLVPQLDGKAQLLDGMCVGPASSTLATTVALPENVLRQRSSTGNAVGFLPILEAYLGWGLSKSAHLLAAIKARAVTRELERALVRQLCGERWAQIEAETPILVGDFWSGLAAVAVETGLAAGAHLPSLSQAGKGGFIATLAHHLKLGWPALWVGTDALDTEAFAEAMDLAVIDAYEELARLPENDGKDGFDDVDTAGDPAAWQAACRDATALRCGRPLAQLILPQHRATGLVEADYSLMLADEVHGMLERLHLDLNTRGTARWLSPEALQAGFLLWTNPAQIVRSGDWKEQLARFLDDRQTSRAVRYAALRYRASRNQFEGPSQR